jgi:hypothetical protein
MLYHAVPWLKMGHIKKNSRQGTSTQWVDWIGKNHITLLSLYELRKTGGCHYRYLLRTIPVQVLSGRYSSGHMSSWKQGGDCMLLLSATSYTQVYVKMTQVDVTIHSLPWLFIWWLMSTPSGLICPLKRHSRVIKTLLKNYLWTRWCLA